MSAIQPAMAALIASFQQPQQDQSQGQQGLAGAAGYSGMMGDDERRRPRPPSTGMRPTGATQTRPIGQAIQPIFQQHQQALQQQQLDTSSHVAASIPGTVTEILGSDVRHVPMGQQPQRPADEDWVMAGHDPSGHQGQTDYQIGQRRAYNKLFSSLDPKAADAARSIVDAGGNMDHVIKWLDMQHRLSSQTGGRNAATAGLFGNQTPQEVEQNRKDAEANIEYNTYGPEGLKGHEKDEQLAAEQERNRGTASRANQSRIDRLTKSLAGAHHPADREAFQKELDEANKEVLPAGGNYASGAEINNSPEGRADLQRQQMAVQMRAPIPGTKLDAKLHPEILNYFLSQAQGSTLEEKMSNARQLAVQSDWRY